MRFLFVSAFVCICLIVPCLAASSTTVAVAKAQGEFRIDNAAVTGNGTIFDGSTVETGTVRSDLYLREGGMVTIQPYSTGRVVDHRVVLSKGMADIRNTRFAVEARSLQITLDARDARAQVLLVDEHRVRVTAAGASAGVRNAQGILVARVMPGGPLEFDTQTAQSASQQFQGSGVISQTEGHFYLTDFTTHVKVELKGSGLDKLVGRQVEVKGTITYATAATTETPAVVQVVSCIVIKAAAAAGAGAATGATAAGVATGISTGTIAVIGGIAAASVAGGLYGAGVIGGSEKPVSR